MHPEACEFLVQVFVFLRDRSLDSIHICAEFFIGHISYFGPHLSEMNVKSFANVEAVLGR